MISKLINSLLFCFFCLCVQAQITEDKTEAMQLAKAEQKHILLVFAGSDWCQPCIRFDKEILQEESFKNLVATELVVLKCDFPQRKTLSEKTRLQNEALAEEFNPNGEFPSILLLDANMNLLANLKYKGQSPTAFIDLIKKELPAKTGMKEYQKREALMGSFFDFIVVAPENEAAATWEAINSCIEEAQRIEALISEWNPASEISKINAHAGKGWVQVSDETYQLIQRSLAISKLTQGAFDLTFLPLYDHWKFRGTASNPFDTATIKTLTPFVDYKQITLTLDNQIAIPKGFKLGLGGIGQGYAVDKIKALLLEKGYANFVINSSGDIYAQGKKADGRPWKIGIASPLDRDKIVQWLPVENFAVVTSGTSEKNFEYQGVFYSHIINPITGFPVQGLQSATVFSEYTEIADALATSILILGPEIGLDLINQMPKTHCVFIDNEQNIHYSNDLELKN